MSDLFSSSCLEAVFIKIAEQLQQQGYCVLPHALPEKLLAALIEQAEQQADFREAGVGRADYEQKNREIRRDKISWIDADSPANTAWLAWCESLKEFLNRRLFLGLCSYESHYALYQAGDFYQRHLDAFRRASHQTGSKRILSMVTYLNSDWPQDAGGKLLLYDLNNHLLEEVSPDAGRLVVFLSEEFPHEVLPAKQKRLSIATWFRSKS